MSNKTKIIIFIILAILVISVIINIYFLIISKNKTTTNPANTNNTLQNTKIEENKTKNENIATNTTNTTSNTISNTVTKVNLSNETNDNSTQVITNNSDANVDELKKLLENYCVGIQRISYNEENLESNTVLLFLAKQYFDTNSNKKSSLKVDTTYASTVENIHQYLTELTGKDYTKSTSLSSYKNYIGYSSSNNAYIYGKDISTLKNEEYECPKLELVDNNQNGTYTAKGEVIRIVNNTEETAYDIELTFKINSNYKYQKYQIISLKAANKSFYPDNTIHLIEQTEEKNNGR